jgi:hypothetical protein
MKGSGFSSAKHKADLSLQPNYNRNARGRSDLNRHSFCSALGLTVAIPCLSLVTLSNPGFSQALGFFAKISNPEQYVQTTPSDCEYIAESSILGPKSFFIIQPCHRGGGAWLHEVPKATRIAPGILFIPKQSLSDGEVAPGFWCSSRAKRTGITRSMKCTRSGWREAPPY